MSLQHDRIKLLIENHQQQQQNINYFEYFILIDRLIIDQLLF